MNKQDFQLELLQKFDKKLIADLIRSYEANARNNKSGSSLLMQSLEGKVLSEEKYRLLFENYGRFLEIGDTKDVMIPVSDKPFNRKNSKHTIKVWVENNFSKFNYVPGYKEKSMVKKNIAVDRIAWGVAISMKKGKKEKKSRKWFTSVMWKAVAELKEDLAEHYIDLAQDLIAQK